MGGFLYPDFVSDRQAAGSGTMMYKKRKEAFEKAKTPQGAFRAIWCNAPDYKSYQHYTSLDTVLKVIMSRQFILSRGDSINLNDLREGKKFGGVPERMKRSYIACFGHGAGESVAMWGLYGKSNPLAMRITIPGAIMAEWIRNIQFAADSKQIAAKADFRDVVYAAFTDKTKADEWDIRRTNVLRWEDSVFRCKSANGFRRELQDGEYGGWLKDYEWHYERETRLYALLPKAIGNKPLFAVVPKDVIASMRFTFSPWADDAMAKVIETSINAALSAIGIPAARPKFQRFRRSVLQGALNFK